MGRFATSNSNQLARDFAIGPLCRGSKLNAFYLIADHDSAAAAAAAAIWKFPGRQNFFIERVSVCVIIHTTLELNISQHPPFTAASSAGN